MDRDGRPGWLPSLGFAFLTFNCGVDYRHSPEHRFPTAYDDGFAALRFLNGGPDPGPGSGALPIDAARCFLVGDNAGGNIAHHVACRYALEPFAFANVRLAGLIAI